MAVSKCVKCGANIPEGAGFCPACGAPKAEAAPAPAAPQPVVQPVPVKRAGPGLQGMIDTLLSPKLITIGLFIGVLVAWISRIVMQFLFVGTAPYSALLIVRFTFMVGVGGLLLCGGLLNAKLNVYVRAALIAAGGVIIGVHL
ncbi:MAG: zinc ribbon domain-containing protein [Thermoplasmatales archaeon]|nr:zinc ribbon domain-containing protein [Thermoplasmatales archaeon]